MPPYNDSRFSSMSHTLIMNMSTGSNEINEYWHPGGGGTSLWVRRGCAPVLGSFWPENSGIGVSFYW